MWKTKIREVFPSVFLLINSITWFSLTWFVVQGLLTNASFNHILLVSFSYFGALIVSAIIGATVLNKKLREKTWLLTWILLGTVTCSVAPLVAPGASVMNLFLVSVPLGALAGLGIPTCLAFFSRNSKAKNRGRNSAVVFFAIQALIAAFYMAINLVSVDTQFLVLSAWRLVGVASVFFLVPSVEVTAEEQKTQLIGIIRDRTFYLYFVPWFLFAIVNFIEEPLLEYHFSTPVFVPYDLYTLATFLITSLAAFLGGVLCDFKGRKVSSILGFVMLGLGFAFLSLLDGMLAQILYLTFGGVAWGVLYVTFIFVVWGDMSEGKNREKYYVLGGMPFLFSNLISVLVQPFAAVILIPSSFSLASFFLFLAILPLLYAPETLSEKIMKSRELKNYIEKAKREVEKVRGKEEPDEQKEECKSDESEPKEDVEFEVGQEEMEKACELADKYY